MKEQMIIEVRGLEKHFPAFDLKDIGFFLPEGYIMGFIGANGAGKTTTIRLLLNMLRHDGGEVRIFGWDHVEYEQQIKDDIGVVFDWVYLVDEWTLNQAVQALRPFYRRWNQATFDGYCHRFGVPKDKKIKDMSRGTQVKLSLAIALSHEAKLLILDEPTSGLDPMARDTILEILQEYIADGKHSVLFSTHITGDLEKIADYITFIHQGRLLYTGTKDGFTDGFFLVKGEDANLSQYMGEKVIGIRKYSGGFEGLIKAKDRKAFDSRFSLEPPSIEDIMVYVGKEDVK